MILMIFGGGASLQARQQFADGDVGGQVERRVVLAPFRQLFLALHVRQLAKHHL